MPCCGGGDVAQDPRQLRHIFSYLEENNLFLIQTAQEAEEAAEAATAKMHAAIAQVPSSHTCKSAPDTKG